MRVFTLRAIENDMPEIEVDLSGDELNLIEVALLELYDNVQFEDNMDGGEKHDRMQLIHGLLIKLGEM